MWREPAEQSQQEAEMTDVVFRINCTALPVDHAALLSSAICEQLPWLAQCTNAGVHPIHVAGSQNGWERPEADGEDLLMLSKRTRLKVRVPDDRANELIEGLSGRTLALREHSLRIESARLKMIEPTQTLFSRYTWFDHESASGDESRFIELAIEQCRAVGFDPQKILCGRTHRVECDTGLLLTRSVLLADVPAAQSIKLQDQGLGSFRLMGCGLLIPHKDTGAVSQN